MATRNIQAFKNAKQANESMNNAILNAKKQMVLDLLNEIKPFANVARDIYDTYVEVRKLDEKYAHTLWHFLSSYTTKEDYKINVNSYFGFSWRGADYYTHITITPCGLAIYYNPTDHSYIEEWNSKQWKDNNATEYIKNGTFTEKQLELYITSIKGLMQYFNTYADKFFDLVEHPQF